MIWDKAEEDQGERGEGQQSQEEGEGGVAHRRGAQEREEGGRGGPARLTMGGRLVGRNVRTREKRSPQARSNHFVAGPGGFQPGARQAHHGGEPSSAGGVAVVAGQGRVVGEAAGLTGMRFSPAGPSGDGNSLRGHGS